MKDDIFRNTEYYLDYIRYRTFEFLAEEIKVAGIKGVIAELGVFRGTFSALLNEKFSHRSLDLFDTFEGFEVKEAEAEREKADAVRASFFLGGVKKQWNGMKRTIVCG